MKAQIDSIYTQLKSGADFAELAKEKSDDKRSSVQGGEMPWFTAGRMIPEFANPAFELKNVGDFTEPVETAFGYHIIKKLNTRPVPTFEESKAILENRIKTDPERSITSKQVFIEKLKTEYNYAENEEGKAKLRNKTTTETLENNDFELFKIDSKSYKMAQFQEYLKGKMIEQGTYSEHFKDWVEFEITALENSKLEEKYPDFRYLFQEYHDGILLFNISEEKIWNFAARDSSGLEEYFKKNNKKYFWEERFKGQIITCKDETTRELADQYFSAEMPVEEIKDLLNETENAITITEGAWEKGANPVVDFYVWNGPEPENFDSALTFVRGDKIQPEPKSLNEARGLYVSDYQKHLEENWIKDLRKKYKIKVNKKLLKTIKGV